MGLRQVCLPEGRNHQSWPTELAEAVGLSNRTVGSGQLAGSHRSFARRRILELQTHLPQFTHRATAPLRFSLPVRIPARVARIANISTFRRRSRPSWPRPHDVICQTRTRNAAGADATAAGDLSAGSDTDALAHFVLTVNYGLTVQATTGATRRDLERVADSILRDWPPTN